MNLSQAAVTGVFSALFVTSSLLAQNPGQPLEVQTERLRSLVVQGGAGGGQVVQGWGGGATYYLPVYWSLAQESVRREIDLVPEQDQKLLAISKDYQTKMNEFYAPLRDPKIPQEERTQKYKEAQEKLTTLNQEVTKQVKEILLPHQVKTLDQIDLRQKAATMLQYAPYVEKLNLSDETKDKIKKKRDALNEAVAKMQREAFDEILQLLTPEQREQLKQPWQGQYQAPAQNPAK